jgi:hypothetical protein
MILDRKTFGFVGPTGSTDELRKMYNISWVPPIKKGDIYEIVKFEDVRNIIIIDGYFRNTSAVWHKEIMWAMQKGVTVCGCSSMGALRAAELAEVGMLGFGKIFESYCSKQFYPFDDVFDADDEVAILHSPVQLNYRPITIPLVNVRASLYKALESNIATPEEVDNILKISRGIYYQRRTIDEIVKMAEIHSQSNQFSALTHSILTTYYVDQKLDDAKYALRELTTLDRDKQDHYSFPTTVIWEQGKNSSSHDYEVFNDDPLTHRKLFEEISINSKLFGSVVDLAFCRFVLSQGLDLVAFDSIDFPTDVYYRDLRDKLNLGSASDLTNWKIENHVNEDSWLELSMYDQYKTWFISLGGINFRKYVLLEAKLSGDFPNILERAVAKQEYLTTLPATKLSPSKRTLFNSLMWYFSHEVRSPLPDNIRSFALGRGYTDYQKFEQVIHREYLFINRPTESCTTSNSERFS